MRVRRCVKNHVRLKKTVSYLLIAVAAYFGRVIKYFEMDLCLFFTLKGEQALHHIDKYVFTLNGKLWILIRLKCLYWNIWSSARVVVSWNRIAIVFHASNSNWILNREGWEVSLVTFFFSSNRNRDRIKLSFMPRCVFGEREEEMCVCVCKCVCLCMHGCACVRAWVYVSVWVCVRAWVRVCLSDRESDDNDDDDDDAMMFARVQQ